MDILTHNKANEHKDLINFDYLFIQFSKLGKHKLFNFLKAKAL